MINKKLFVLSFLFFVCLVGYLYAEDNGKNFVALLSGETHTVESKKSAYSFIGQPVVFDEKEADNAISRSAFASAFYIVQSPDISFRNDTDDIVYTDINVDLKFYIKSEDSSSNVSKIRYRVWQGEDVDWNNYTKCPEKELEPGKDFTVGQEVNLVRREIFSEGRTVNYFKFYAQLANGAKRWSEAYIVRLTSGLASAIEITSPDKYSKTAAIDPIIETKNFSLSYVPVKISLYNGTVTGEEDPLPEPMYSIDLSTTTNESFESKYGIKIYDGEKIACTNSQLVTIYNGENSSANTGDDENSGEKLPLTLTNNQKYTLAIIPTDSTVAVKGSTVTFKALSGGVADILTYPSPFNPKKQKVKIKYLLAKEGNVTIRLYDKAGKVVCKLIDSEHRPAGTNEEEWDGRNYAGERLATGAYIVEIIANGDRRYTALAIVGK